MDEIINGVAQTGILGCVLAYFMYTLNTTIKQNTETINSLKELIIQINTKKLQYW